MGSTAAATVPAAAVASSAFTSLAAAPSRPAALSSAGDAAAAAAPLACAPAVGAAADTSLVAPAATAIAPVCAETASSPSRTAAALAATEVSASPTGLVDKSDIAAATPLLAAAIPDDQRAATAAPLSAVLAPGLGLASLPPPAERAAVPATHSVALSHSRISATSWTSPTSPCAFSPSSPFPEFSGLSSHFTSASVFRPPAIRSTRPVQPPQLWSGSCPCRRSPAAGAAQSECDTLLLLDDKLLLLLLSFLTLQEQLVSFLPLTRRLYAAALRLPFVKHLVVPPPGHAFEAFLTEVKTKCVSFFPPHSGPTSSSPINRNYSRSTTRSCAERIEEEWRGGKELTAGSGVIHIGCNRETSRSSSSAASSSGSTTSPATRRLSGSSAGTDSSSSASDRAGDTASAYTGYSWLSNTSSSSHPSAVLVGGACSCCCIPVSFLHLSRLQSADIAAPALTPPSPLLALLLLLNARSLKNLRIRGVDEGSFSWNASVRQRRQQQQKAVQQHQAVQQHPQQSLQHQGHSLQQKEHHSEEEGQRLQWPKQHCLQHEEEEKQLQSWRLRKNTPNGGGWRERREREDYVRRTAAKGGDGYEAVLTPTPGTAEAREIPAETSAEDGLGGRTRAAAAEEREAAATASAKKSAFTKTPRKRARLQEYGAEPAREGGGGWEAMLADSLRFAAAASATPAVLRYMQQLHQSSSRHRDISEVKGGCTVLLLTEDGSPLARSIPPAAPPPSSDKCAGAPSSERSWIPANAAAATTRDETAVPGNAGAGHTFLKEKSAGLFGEGYAAAAQQENDEERTLYWLPRMALQLLLANARNLETLAIDVSRRKGLFRVAPLARLFLLEEDDEVTRPSSIGSNIAAQSNIVFSAGEGFRMLQQRPRQQQGQRAQEQLHCGFPQQGVSSVGAENPQSAGGTGQAREQHDYDTRQGGHCRSPLSKSDTTAGRFCTHITPISCCEGQDTYSSRMTGRSRTVLTETGDPLWMSEDRERSEDQRGCCRLRELEVCNITPTTFVCGYISLPQIRVLKLHFVEIASRERSVHDLGVIIKRSRLCSPALSACLFLTLARLSGLLQGCPLLEDFAVHTDSDDDQMVFLNRLLIRSLGRFFKTQEPREYVRRVSHPADTLRWGHHNRQEDHRQYQEQHLGGQRQQHLQEEQRRQQQGTQQKSQPQLLQHRHDRTQLLAGVAVQEAATVRAAKEEKNKDATSTLHRECDPVLDVETRVRRLHHLKSFQMMLLDIRVIELLAQAAPNLQVLRLIEMEAFRSSEGRDVLVTAVRRLPQLRRVELLGDLSETEGRSRLEALFDAEARARDWPPGTLSLHHGASVVQNFFLPQL